MAWEYEGLFDVLPQESGTLLDSFWRSEATAARIGTMAYRTRTTKAGTRLEAEIYPIFGRSMEQTARAARERITPERQQQLNTRRSKRRLVLLLENNFRADEDVHVTLTYAGEEPELARVKMDVRNFLNRIRRLREKRGLPELKYIYAIGHDQGHRAHVHVVMNGGISRDEIEKNWRTGRGSGRGVANTYRLQEYGSGLQGMASYLYRQNEKARDNGERQGAHMWCASRNLKKTEGTDKRHENELPQGAHDCDEFRPHGEGDHGESLSGIYAGGLPGALFRHCGRGLYTLRDAK